MSERPLGRPPGLPDAVWEVIERATAKEPNQRFRNAKELAEVLRERIPPASPSELGRPERQHLGDVAGGMRRPA